MRGRWPRPGWRPPRRDEERQDEEQSGDDGGDAGASAGRHAGVPLFVPRIKRLRRCDRPTRASAADQGVRPTICGNALAASYIEEAQYEEGGQQVDEPIPRGELAAQNLQQVVRRKAKGKAVGDAAS